MLASSYLRARLAAAVFALVPVVLTTTGRADSVATAAVHRAQPVSLAAAIPRAVSSRPLVSLTHLDTPVTFTSNVDSNTPVVWDLVRGRQTMSVLTSTAGRPSLARGSTLASLGAASPAAVNPWPGGGVWMESVLRDSDGTLYGFYHNERVATVCDTDRVTPRIGAARSQDHGATWTDLGVVLEAPESTFACESTNRYFVGGVGDLNAVLDDQSQFVYLYVSEYGRDPGQQGIAVARLLWADRDAPTGKVEVWSDSVWLPASAGEGAGDALLSGPDRDGLSWSLPAPAAIFPPTRPWHDGDDVVDAFWGPSIHWNTFLQEYVMLMNRAADENFAQEGIYVSFNPRIDDPAGWSAPVRILEGGSWYPQVVGLEPARGTDKLAGETARFFMGGRSEYLIRFTR